MRARKMLEFVRSVRAGAPLGDVVLLKLDAVGVVPPGAAERLVPLRGYSPVHDVASLRRLAPGTLGREYARFLDEHRIQPLAVSDAMRARFRDEPYVLRYTATHDLHHVLAGFDTGLAGEIGVLAFDVGQGGAPVTRALFVLARTLYQLLSPMQAWRIRRNARVGLEIGARAKALLAEKLEQHFEEPLVDVRRELGIADPRASGVVASGTSWVTRLLAPAYAS